MIIRFERTGGFTAIPLRLNIDVDQLAPDEHQNLRGLVENSGFFNLPVKLAAAGSGTDRFHYKLTVEESDHVHTVEAGDASLPEDLQPLIQHLTQLARSSRT
jgi:hypothetical protein